jgi:hypothetical protein
LSDVTCSYICMYVHYIHAYPNSVMLQLYLWHDFYNVIFKIKHKLYECIASGSAKNSGCAPVFHTFPRKTVSHPIRPELSIQLLSKPKILHCINHLKHGGNYITKCFNVQSCILSTQGICFYYTIHLRVIVAINCLKQTVFMSLDRSQHYSVLRCDPTHFGRWGSTFWFILRSDGSSRFTWPPPSTWHQTAIFIFTAIRTLYPTRRSVFWGRNWIFIYYLNQLHAWNGFNAMHKPSITAGYLTGHVPKMGQ